MRSDIGQKELAEITGLNIGFVGMPCGNGRTKKRLLSNPSQRLQTDVQG